MMEGLFRWACDIYWARFAVARAPRNIPLIRIKGRHTRRVARPHAPTLVRFIVQGDQPRGTPTLTLLYTLSTRYQSCFGAAYESQGGGPAALQLLLAMLNGDEILLQL